MDEKRFRFDLLIAVFALLLSGIAAGAAAYQTWVINEQFSATVWPYLGLSATYSPGQFRLELTNDGLGPAIVKSADITIGDTVSQSWMSLIVHAPKPSRRLAIFGRFSSLENGDVIRSGEDKVLLDLHGSQPFPNGIREWIRDKHVTMNVCYCSILQRCWIAHFLGDGDPTPQDVPTCGPTHKLSYG